MGNQERILKQDAAGKLRNGKQQDGKLRMPWRELVAFCVTGAFFVGCLLLTAMIPRGSIRNHLLESAEYLCEGELFGTVVEGVNSSKIDRYADSIGKSSSHS